jgi:outer membrane protein assembly factor BamD (BamD/ComL family)
MLSPQRDQTATREALRELQVFLSNYTNSKYLPEVIALERETRDRLSESEFLIGRHYYRTGWYPGAVSRLEALLKTDPQYTHRDGAYFFLAESYAKQARIDDARTYYQKVVDEFAVSEFLDDAAKRLKALEGQTGAAPSATATAEESTPTSTPATPATPPAPAPTDTTVTPASRPSAANP